jgi:nitroreductase
MMTRREKLKWGASVVAGMANLPAGQATEKAPDRQTTESFLEVIRNRRSVRQFKPDPVPEEHLLKIVDAARMAPCAGNEQPWKFLVVQDKKQIEALKNECLKEFETYLKENQNLSGEALKTQVQQIFKDRLEGRLSAPAYIVVLVDGQRKYPDYNQHDGPLAAGYLLLAARALGYGSVYLTDSVSVQATKKAFNIPDRYIRVCITPIGVPVEWPTKEKKALDEFIVKERF